MRRPYLRQPARETAFASPGLCLCLGSRYALPRRPLRCPRLEARASYGRLTLHPTRQQQWRAKWRRWRLFCGSPKNQSVPNDFLLMPRQLPQMTAPLRLQASGKSRVWTLARPPVPMQLRTDPIVVPRALAHLAAPVGTQHRIFPPHTHRGHAPVCQCVRRQIQKGLRNAPIFATSTHKMAVTPCTGQVRRTSLFARLH